MDNKNLRTAFRALPEDIKEWLFSEKVTYSLMELNRRLNIKGERGGVISKLVARLVTQDVDARDFVNELAIELNIGNSAAKAITKEVEERVLHQIETSLRTNLGVDVALLHMDKEVSLESITPLPDESPKQAAPAPRATMPIPDVAREEMTPHISAPMAPKMPEAAPSGPFILHTEKEPVKPIAPPINAPQRPTFSIKIPLAQKKYGAPPVTAKIETPPPPEATGGKAGTPEIKPAEPLRQAQGQTPREFEPRGSRIIPVPPLLKIVPPPLRRLPPLPPKPIAPVPLTIPAAPAPAPTKPILPPKPKTPILPTIQKVVHYSDFYTKLANLE